MSKGILKITKSELDTLKDPSQITPETLKPRFEERKDGLYFIGLDANGEKPPLRIAGKFEIIGRGTLDMGACLVIRANGETDVLPMADIGTQKGFSQLMSREIFITASRHGREQLANYLQTHGSRERYTLTPQAGWHDNAYILPSGEVIGESGKLLYCGDKSQSAAYGESGSLKDWQDNIAHYMTGNSRLTLTIGAALAAPLMRLLGIESGGFHLFGDSRDGKSTAAKAALSVYGKPDDLSLSWTGTSLGFNNAANARNDGLMMLDEIGQAQPRHVSLTAYSLINGVNKVQGARDGGNRDIGRWKVLLLSTGEKPLDNFLQLSGSLWNAGQAARLPSIPSNAGHGLGIYDTLHGFEKGSLLSEHLSAAAEQYHGTAGRALIRLLAENTAAMKGEASAAIAAFMQILPDVDGQARTVALRFALVAAALVLAARHGITGQPETAIFPAVKQCFDAWAAREGTGKHEDKTLLTQAADFMQKFANSPRFILYPLPDEATHFTADLAGYRRHGTEAEKSSYYILPSVFRDEICKGFDIAKGCEVLHEARWLQKNKADRWQFQLKGKGRFYLLIGAIPPSEEEDEDEVPA